MKYLFAVLSSLLLAGTAVASNIGDIAPPASRATAANISITGTETDGGTGDCSFVTIDITADIEGTNDLGEGLDQVRFAVWDDAQEMDFEIVSVPVGDTQTVNVTLTFEGQVGLSAPGVGVYISSDGSTVYSEDPFYPDVVAGSCPGGDNGIPTSPLSVPVNSAWSLILLSGVLALLGFGVLRSRG